MRKILVIIAIPILLSPRLAIAQTSGTTYSASPVYSPASTSFGSPSSVVYGQGGPNYMGIIQPASSAVGQVINGNSIGVLNSAPGILSQIPGLNISSQNMNLIQQGLPVLTSLLSGGSVSGALTSGLGILAGSGVLNGQQSQILGAASPLISSLLNGNLSAGSVLSSLPGLLTSIFPSLANSPVFGVLSGVLGGLFGGGGSGIAGAASGIYTSPMTNSSLATLIYGGATSGNPANPNTIIGQSGSILCAYNSTCTQSNPSAIRPLFSAAAGAMGVANSNYVRGQIAQLSRQGIQADRFASPFSPEENAHFEGVKSDYEINRASTEAILSKQGQQAIRDGLDTAVGVAKFIGENADKSYKSTRSTQGLIRELMRNQSTDAAYSAAFLEYMAQAQLDDQQMKIQMGNTADATTKLQRELTSERSAYAAQLVRSAALYDKPTTLP
jgi:hypothetical protein